MTPRRGEQHLLTLAARSTEIKTNALYYGDNLEILREYFPAESVDLVYLDPPFNSKQGYNVIFRDESGRDSDAQMVAFEDTWHWGPRADHSYSYLTETARHRGTVPGTVSTIISALRSGIGKNQMMAYIVEMSVRLVELRRVLKPTGSLYIHCDPTASHYLKIVLDSIFGPQRFLAEIVWKRTSAHSSANRPGPVHDVILQYSGGPNYKWRPQFQPYDREYLDLFFEMRDPDGRHWKRTDLTGAGIRHGATGNVWRGIDVTAKRRHWAYPPDELERLDAAGRVHWPTKVGGMPRLKQYVEDMPGVPLQDVWTDIRPIHNLAVERVGYPTQKPLSLLERIITASTDPGDLVLDPFCGCGTALIAAESLGRRWVGIDLTYLAIGVMSERLKRDFQIHNVEVIGQPTELAGARQLAEGSPSGRYQFQWWALSLVGAESEDGLKRKGADRGIDGRITFSTEGGGIGCVLVSVKSGHVSASQVRDLVGTVEREYAAIGIFLTLSEPTRAMRREAATAGQYRLRDRDYPKIQILSIREILEDHRKPILPPLVLTTDEQTGRTRGRAGQQLTIDDMLIDRELKATAERPSRSASRTGTQDPSGGCISTHTR